MKKFLLLFSVLFIILALQSCENKDKNEYLQIITANNDTIYCLTSIHDKSLVDLWRSRGGNFITLNDKDLKGFIPINDGTYEGNDYVSLSFINNTNNSSDNPLNKEDISNCIELLMSHQILNAPNNISSFYFNIQQSFDYCLESIYNYNELKELSVSLAIEIQYGNLSPDEIFFKKLQLSRLDSLMSLSNHQPTF